MVTPDGFEWDEAKAIANQRKHDISFEEAVVAFCDYFAIEVYDEREAYGEERINLLGLCRGVVLHVTYTERDSGIRLISARKANPHEQHDYYSKNTQGRDGR